MEDNKTIFEKKIADDVRDNYSKVGKLIVDKISLLLEGHVGGPTPLTQSLSYKKVNDEIHIMSDTPIIRFLDKGTEPHTIEPKRPGGALKFRAEESVTRKDGSRVGFGDTILARKVEHPGIEAMQFTSQALKLVEKDLGKKLFK